MGLEADQASNSCGCGLDFSIWSDGGGGGGMKERCGTHLCVLEVESSNISCKLREMIFLKGMKLFLIEGWSSNVAF